MTAAPSRAARPVTLVGLGGMGAAMGLRLLDAGHPLTVYNRTAAKAEPLARAGAQVAATAADAVDGVEVVLLSLADERAVDQVLFDQALPRLKAGCLVVDTSTVSPEYARAAQARLAEAGVRRVEACVAGNPLQARAGELRVLTAGDRDDVEAVDDVLRVIGRDVAHLGAAGNASVLKLVWNLLLGAQVAALAEATAYGVAAGLDRDELLAAVAESGFSSRVLSFRAGLMRERRYTPPAFRSALMHKDLRLGIADAERAGIRLPVVEAVARRFADLVEAGDADLDAAALVELQHRDRGAPAP
jgi:3-hydroxyisobutyrate dehydrogenase-like beta-hydroxyacid dehydrogenase